MLKLAGCIAVIFIGIGWYQLWRGQKKAQLDLDSYYKDPEGFIRTSYRDSQLDKKQQ